ncbi:MAG TPA: hypothetical protein VOA80_00675 [Thermoanaerobaculia bacterium]|nr:hypothetical protein [Thermoanaerobaculia bacterium]
MEQIVNYVTCFAAVGLFIATCALVWVTIHHARAAERMAAAADRLGRQAEALTEVTGVHALVSAIATQPLAVQPSLDLIGPLIQELTQRHKARTTSSTAR